VARFRARARAVDLLGRQQIAGIPTAVHELFKNAHDAYADHVEVDYFRKNRLFVLRDDGVGMTREEFEGRWLVVGTESKTSSRAIVAPPMDNTKPSRPVLGEKGIGRLATGLIGDQLLVVSKAERDGERFPTVVALVLWPLYAIPGIDLDQIDVPVAEVPDGQRVDAAVVRDLVDRCRKNALEIQADPKVDPDAIDAVLKALDRFAFDPAAVDAQLPGPASLRVSAGARGTQFWVFPTNAVIDADLTGEDKSASEMQRQLVGFANQMTPGAPTPVIQVAFRDHRSGADVVDVIGEEAFFSPGEYTNADHYIAGSVDEFGTFRGTVSIYGEAREHIIPWHGRPGQPARCGSFEVHLAYVMGQQVATTLPDAAWRMFTAKTERLGGVYLYMDGIRVVPYGQSDFDWLKIEENRSKSAYFYFFSHRRMCGAVLLSRAANSALAEKAGREGLVRNAAYRDLLGILQHILLQLAAEFFRKEGARAERFYAERERLGRISKAAQRRAEQVRPKRKQLERDLSRFFETVASDVTRARAEQVLMTAREQVDAALSRDDADLPAYLAELHRKHRGEVKALRQDITVPLPRIALDGQLKERVREYQRLLGEVESLVLRPIEVELAALTDAAFAAANQSSAWLAALHAEVREAEETAENEVKASHQRLRQVNDEAARRVRDGAHQRREEALGELRSVLAEFGREATASALQEEVLASRERHLHRIRELQRRTSETLDGVSDQLEGVSWDAAASSAEQLLAAEQDVLDMKDVVDDVNEATQLGLAVAVISHEFAHNIVSIRDALRTLKAWADKNAGLREVYQDLRREFEHLDGFLTLFTPLQRRLYREPVLINGDDLEMYLRRVFAPRTAENHVELRATPAFLNARFKGFRSVYYPAMVNLVDNALCWVKGRSIRVITLDAEPGALVVQDTGPGVDPDDRELIFRRGFSTKPGGHGLGLAIARDTLRGVGADLVNEDAPVGARFRITLPPNANPDAPEPSA
jgi:signal transduction histidine kinase